MPFGFNGRILRVNLSARTTSIEEPQEGVYRSFLGGGALASYFLLKEQQAQVDPLGPESMLAFMTSVITGTQLSGLNRFTVAAKSPLTGGYGESEAGGWWAPELKLAGYDGVIVQGRAAEPLYLWIQDGQVAFREAGHLWGKLSGDVQNQIRAELDDDRIRVVQTGIAGENLVRYAAIVNELKHFNGRAGLGAVMASKNLKAIAVRASKRRLDLHDAAAARAITKWYADNCDLGSGTLHDVGTSRGVMDMNSSGTLPTHNFRKGTFEYAEQISGERMRDTILVRRGTCHGCVVACKREVRVEECGVDPQYGGPEYETIAATGSLCGIGDLDTIAKANQLLNQYVLDSISTGAVIAFAMECYEKGLLSKKDTGGLDLHFGNGQALLALIEMIARRQGIGDVLAEGVKRASEKIGGEATQYAMHVKGQELPMHEPRGKRGLALAYAVSPTGADHLEAVHDPLYESFAIDSSTPFSPLGLVEPVDRLDLSAKKVRAFYYAQMVWSLYNSIGVCNFVGVPHGDLTLKKLVDHIKAVTGWETSVWELLKVGEKANTMSRMYNMREGIGKANDALPDRMFVALENGALKGQKIDRNQFRDALNLYYRMAGWDPDTGRPTRAKLAELDLEWLHPQ